MQAHIYIFVIPLIIVLALTAGFVICDNRKEGCGQRIWKEEVWGHFRGSAFCEEETPETVLSHQQDSTSNFAFMYFGMVIIGLSFLDYKNRYVQFLSTRNHMTTKPYLSFLYGVFMFYMGFGSFIYHAHSSDITFAYDMHSILNQVLFVIFTCSLLHFPLNAPITRIYTFISLTIIFIVSSRLYYLAITDVIGSDFLFSTTIALIPFIVIAISSNVFIRCFRNKRKITKTQLVFYLLNLFSFIGGLCTQEQFIDVKCIPTSRFQFHALWHVFAAAGFFFIYLGLRLDHFPLRVEFSETIDPRDKLRYCDLDLKPYIGYFMKTKDIENQIIEKDINIKQLPVKESIART